MWGNEHGGQREVWDGEGATGDRSHRLLGPTACLNRDMFTRQPRTGLTLHSYPGRVG